MEKKHKPTAKDVAKRAGVSASTVSRVLSNHPKISAKTKERVLKEMKILGYQPNVIARSLASSCAMVLGVMVPERSTDALSNPFFPEALRGIVAGAKNYGYDILLSSSDFQKEEEIANFLGSGRVDGVILFTARRKDSLLNYLKKMDFPTCLIGSSTVAVNQVDNDNRKAAYEATRHLLNTGHKNLLLLTGPANLTVTHHRQLGFQNAIKDAGSLFQGRVLRGEFDEASGVRFARLIHEQRVKPDAILASDDVIAFGLIMELSQLGYDIPGDVAVASFNNSLLSRYSQPPLTTVEINPFQLGKASVQVLVESMRESTSNLRRTIPHELIIRASSQKSQPSTIGKEQLE